MTKSLFALVDCNNFFVSCERLFTPQLHNKPVVVLSSNDGCVVARSNEAKALGIPMGAPAFKFQPIFQQHQVARFSANFELYGDISRRIIQVLTALTPRIEVYSIDEAFLDISQLPLKSPSNWARKLREEILKTTGIPVSIGIAPTKTLAKLASDRAKKNVDLEGVLSIDSTRRKLATSFMQETAVEDVWGIGRKLAPRLRAEGITHALELSQLPTKLARQRMGLRGEQIVRELNGMSCLPLAQFATKPKSIARTRTFGEDTSQFHVIEAAIANFAARVAFQLRQANQLTQRASVFLTTNRHKPGYRAWNSEVTFAQPTADSGLLVQRLVAAAAKLFQSGFWYHRAGIWLYDFVSESQLQTDMFGTIDMQRHHRSKSRMQTIDLINRRYGKDTLHFAAEDLANNWEPKHALRSPRYVSRWEELPRARMLTKLT